MAVAGIVGVGIGWLTYRMHRRNIARAMEIALASPYALPGTVVAIALIQTFGTPSLFAGGAVLVGTFWILPIAYVFRTYPLVLQPTTAALESLDPALPEAAASLGATDWRTFRTVVFPAIRHGGGRICCFRVAVCVSDTPCFGGDLFPAAGVQHRERSCVQCGPPRPCAGNDRAQSDRKSRPQRMIPIYVARGPRFSITKEWGKFRIYD